VRAEVHLPAAGATVRATLFDATHNNPAAGFGGDTPTPAGTFPTAGLSFVLQPDSMVILEPVR
jgi:hypothetical protein